MKEQLPSLLKLGSMQPMMLDAKCLGGHAFLLPWKHLVGKGSTVLWGKEAQCFGERKHGALGKGSTVLWGKEAQCLGERKHGALGKGSTVLFLTLGYSAGIKTRTFPSLQLSTTSMALSSEVCGKVHYGQRELVRKLVVFSFFWCIVVFLSFNG